MIETILFLVIALITTIITGAFGFGTAIILIPISSFFMEIKKAIAILTIYFMSVNISQIYLFWHDIDWKTVRLILYGSIPGVIMGSFLMVISPSNLIKRLLGLLILLYIVNELSDFFKKYRIKKLIISLVSVLYGFFAGIIGTGNSVKAALLTHMDVNKEKFIGIMAATAIITNIVIQKDEVYRRTKDTQYYLVFSV